MSILNVDKIQPIGGGSTITVDATDIQASTGTVRASTFSGDVSATGIGVTSLNVAGVTTFTGAVTSSSAITAHDYRSGGGVGNTLYLTSADDWRFRTTGGSEKLRIDSAGDVGINQNNPTAKLHIVEATSTTAVKIKSGTNTNQSTHITMFNDNDVPLHLGVYGSSANTSGTIASNTAFMSSNSVGGLAINAYHASGAIKFGTGSSQTERLRITSAGKIEVKGTRAGSLQASDDDTLQLYTASTNNNIDRGAGITFYNHDNSGYEMGGTIQVAKENGTADNVAAYMRFSTRPAGGSATERLRIASDGVATFAATNINVNRNAGDAFISLQTSGTSNVALYGGASTGFRVFTKPSGGSLTDRLIIDPDGAAFFKGVSAGAKGTINLESQDPFIRLYDTNGATDRRKWDIRNIGASGYEELDFRTINDANNSFNSVMQIEYGGDVNINDGNLRVANGHGIDFSATGDSAGNQGSSELFDDYEEGTWTPAFKAGNNSTACPTSVSEASYTRVGRLVTATAYFTLTSYAFGTTGGDTRIVGLPYTGIGQHGGVSINYWWGLKQNVNFMAGTVQGNTSEILIRATTSAAVGTANIDFDNTFESGDSLILTATYFTS